MTAAGVLTMATAWPQRLHVRQMFKPISEGMAMAVERGRPVPWMNRALQRDVLQRLGQAYPQWVKVKHLGLDGAARAVVQNLAYLEEHGLVACEPSRGGHVDRAQLMQLGAVFLATADLATAAAHPAHLAPDQARHPKGAWRLP